MKLGGALCVAGGLAEKGTAAVAKELDVRAITIRIGLPKPFKALHFSDTHITLADARENERKLKLSQDRFRYFSNAPKYLAASLAYAKAHGELILHTGDLYDFVSAANLEMAKKTFGGAGAILATGNHEYSLYVGEAKEDDAYKAQSYERVKAAWPNDPTFFARTVNGVNFVAFDDVYSDVSAQTLANLRREVAKGFPIVLMCHVPFYAPALFLDEMKHNKNHFAYIMGTPRERLARPLDGEPKMNAPGVNEPTRAFLEYAEHEPLIKAVLCGHIHREWQGPLPGIGTMQYAADASFRGVAYEITFV